MKIENLELRKVNKILLTFFLLLLGWFLLDVFLSLGKSYLSIVVSEEEAGRTTEESEIKSLPPFSQYAKEIDKRQLFKGTSQEPKQAPSDIYVDEFRILVSDFQLLGIATGTKPQAIIQNKKTNQTYFLYEGQSQDNLKVEDISGSKVKLSYNEEVFELFL